jgi:hypothetical protein
MILAGALLLLGYLLPLVIPVPVVLATVGIGLSVGCSVLPHGDRSAPDGHYW